MRIGCPATLQHGKVMAHAARPQHLALFLGAYHLRHKPSHLAPARSLLRGVSRPVGTRPLTGNSTRSHLAPRRRERCCRGDLSCCRTQRLFQGMLDQQVPMGYFSLVNAAACLARGMAWLSTPGKPLQQLTPCRVQVWKAALRVCGSTKVTEYSRHV